MKAIQILFSSYWLKSTDKFIRWTIISVKSHRNTQTSTKLKPANTLLSERNYRRIIYNMIPYIPSSKRGRTNNILLTVVIIGGKVFSIK